MGLPGPVLDIAILCFSRTPTSASRRLGQLSEIAYATGSHLSRTRCRQKGRSDTALRLCGHRQVHVHRRPWLRSNLHTRRTSLTVFFTSSADALIERASIDESAGSTLVAPDLSPGRTPLTPLRRSSLLLATSFATE